MRYLYHIFAISLLLSGAVRAVQIDQSQTEFNASMSASYFAPVGQSFIPTASSLDQVNLKMLDPGGVGNGSHSVVHIHDGTITGPIIGTSELKFLEDCFNFSQGPGCGLGGGSPVLVSYHFATAVMLNPGQVYVLEVEVQAGGDDVNVAYSYKNLYSNGGYYRFGVLNNNDLWFQTTSSSNSPGNKLLVSTNNALQTYDLSGQFISQENIPFNPKLIS